MSLWRNITTFYNYKKLVLSSQWHCYQIDILGEVGLQQMKSFDSMSKVKDRTNLGYTRVDQTNYLWKRRQNDTFTASWLIIQLLPCLSNRCRRPNLFWAKPQICGDDYEYFGDVSLDSRHCTNGSYRPLAVFLGFNHHWKVTIFWGVIIIWHNNKVIQVPF